MKVLFKIFIIIIIISFFPLSSYDFFWHLKTGEYISKNGIPQRDPFSYNSEGRWVNHAWGYDLLIYCLYKLGGFNLIFFFKFLVVFLSAYLFFLLCKGKNFSLSFTFSLILWAFSLARHRFDIRPDALGHLFFILLLYFLEKRKYVFSLFLLLLWVNFHASFIFGAFLSFLYFFLLFLKEREKKNFYLSLISILIPILNPFGINAYISPIKLSIQIKTLDMINPEWLFAPFIPFLSFYLSVIFVLIYLIIEKVWDFKKFLFFPILFLSISSLRFHGFFSLSFPFFIKFEKKSFKFIFFILGFLALILSFIYYSYPKYGINEKMIPLREMNFLKNINPIGNVFLNPGYGGYFIYKFFPEKRVFWDGRNELYPSLLKEFSHALKSKSNWENFIEKHKINYAIIKYQGLQGIKTGVGYKFLPWSYIYFSKENWDLIYWDDSGMVFMRKGLKNIKTFQFNPEVIDYLLILLKEGKIKKEELLEELRFKLSENPNCKRAKDLLKKVMSY